MIHTIHIKPDALGEGRWDNARAIPETTAKWAVIAPPFWLFWHGLFFELAIYAIITVALLALLVTPYALAALAVASLPTLYLFLEGNQLRRNALTRRGYEFSGVADGQDEEMALARYFDEEVAPVKVETAPPEAVQPLRKTVARDDDLSFGLIVGPGV